MSYPSPQTEEYKKPSLLQGRLLPWCHPN